MATNLLWDDARKTGEIHLRFRDEDGAEIHTFRKEEKARACLFILLKIEIAYSIVCNYKVVLTVHFLY